MKNANQDLNRLRQPNVLPFSVSWRCYLGNLGLCTLIVSDKVTGLQTNAREATGCGG